MQIDTTTILNNGIIMPLFGLGVYLSEEGTECYNAVQTALDLGYRHFDTASFYDNEKSLGKAIRDHSVDRSEIFVTTKLWNADHGYDKTLSAFEKSLKNLDLDYIDLFLIHYPVENIRMETWKAMEKILESGDCKSIGVSNYMTHHMEELLANCNIPPAVNQFELSPYCYQSRADIVSLCRENNIAVEAYSPLVRTKRFDDPKLLAFAKKYGKTPAQILIRWALQENIIVIPKSSNPIRIKENADIFDFSISETDMELINNFDENLIVCWNPMETP